MMMNNKLFVREMQILWQNSDVETRNKLTELLNNYFDKGKRAERIINKMQEELVDKNGQRYVIESLTEKDDETNQPLYWSNEEGWVDYLSADIFTKEERERVNTPRESRWRTYPRLCKVTISTGYFVKWDNEEMVNEAKRTL